MYLPTYNLTCTYPPTILHVRTHLQSYMYVPTYNLTCTYPPTILHVHTHLQSYMYISTYNPTYIGTYFKGRIEGRNSSQNLLFLARFISDGHMIIHAFILPLQTPPWSRLALELPVPRRKVPQRGQAV
jgi:hypothetical protein